MMAKINMDHFNKEILLNYFSILYKHFKHGLKKHSYLTLKVYIYANLTTG